MIKLALKGLLSMLRDRRRIPGRTWLTECYARSVRILFESGMGLPVKKLRWTLSVIKLPTLALTKIKFHWEKISGVASLIIQPIKNTRPDSLILYFHGGGYVVGSPVTYQSFLAKIAVKTGMKIIAPDYRLSPEFPFPAAQQDCLAITNAVRDLNPDISLIVMGDSAGGGLAISAALSDVNIDALMLISPWVEPTADTGSMISNVANDIFPLDFLAQSYASHMQKADFLDSRVNFLNTDLSNLPPSYIQYAGGELLHDQIADFVERAVEQAPAVKVDLYPNQFHVFQFLGPTLSDTKDAITKIAGFIKSVNR